MKVDPNLALHMKYLITPSPSQVWVESTPLKYKVISTALLFAHVQRDEVISHSYW
jgi:hypothetical protein